MAIDFNTPTTTDRYDTGFVPNIQNNQKALAMWLDSVQTSSANTPTYAKRYNRSTGLIEEYNGTSWAALSMGYVLKAGDTMTGNLGLSTAPSAWASTYRAVELSGAGSAIYAQGTTRTGLSNNYYRSATADTYANAGFASVYEQQSGAHNWYTAPSGTAGAAATFTLYMQLGNTGNLGLGNSPSAWWSGRRALEITAPGTTVGQAFLANSPGTANYAVMGSNFYWNTSPQTVYLDAGPATFYSQSNGAHSFYTAASGSAGAAASFSLQFILDAAGNAGFGVTPNAWNSSYTALEVASGGLMSTNSGTGMFLSQNLYYATAGWVYKTAAAGTVYAQNGGSHLWQLAATGTAGAAATVTNAMILNSSGTLLLNSATSSYQTTGRQCFEINGSSSAIIALKIGDTPKGYLYHNGTNTLLYSLAGDMQVNAPTGSSVRLLVNATTILNVTGSGIFDAAGNELGYKGLPQNAQTAAYVLVAGDKGKHISITTGGVTVPASVFSVGDAVTIFNNSASAQTITQGASVTMYLAGTATTGNRSLAQHGLCTLLCVAANTFVISGGGLS